MRVVLHFKASAELQNAFVWYEAKARNLGCEFLDEVDRGIAAIRDAPTLWRLYQDELRVHRFLVHRSGDSQK